MGPKASLSITLWPVDETSAFCTSSSFAAAAFSVNQEINDTQNKEKIILIIQSNNNLTTSLI